MRSQTKNTKISKMKNDELEEMEASLRYSQQDGSKYYGHIIAEMRVRGLKLPFAR